MEGKMPEDEHKPLSFRMYAKSEQIQCAELTEENLRYQAQQFFLRHGNFWFGFLVLAPKGLPAQQHQQDVELSGGMRELEIGYHQVQHDRDFTSQMPFICSLHLHLLACISSFSVGSVSFHLNLDEQGCQSVTSMWSVCVSFNFEANLLFLESPVGVGFSYTNKSSDLDNLNDVFVAEDSYSFLVNWLQRFPEYKDREFYIAGESYADSVLEGIQKTKSGVKHGLIPKKNGQRTSVNFVFCTSLKKKLELPYAAGHYVPQLAELVYERNKDKKGKSYINLKGFIVGNPITNDYYDSKGLAEYAWSHAVVPDEVYNRIKKYCDFKNSNWSDDCSAAMDVIYSQYREIDIYNIYAPKCLLNQTSASSTTRAFFENDQDQLRRRIRMFSGYDPCYSSYAEDYFNKGDVQRAFHANVSGLLPGKWHVCSDPILNSYNFSVFSVLPIYSKLIKAGLRVWIYSGDADGRVPVIGSRYCVESLDLPIKTQWQPWYLDKQSSVIAEEPEMRRANHGMQVAGRFVEYHGMSMVTARGAGHLVPLNKPAEGLTLINTFLRGEQLPAHR
ncbi:hypothetical protein C2845_PM06G06400 [Panicum miliaceum]|uniref:Carboxypeptidase n=1 Tax=Panicum miliaceum TaxID=4540 RepID=A0A3L6REC4_PANMI|nr:hypothetical protein C2845_PM06G06400 [Panicum miliaceum]